MDSIVKQALAKWPHVPACYGWLALDSRGRWYMRDDKVQMAGRFPSSKGSLLQHEKLIEFIGRNYEVDCQGCWFFQNGPQRVYVELEITPWIWRVQQGQPLRSHTGCIAIPEVCLLDELGRVYLHTNIGLGLVHSLDVEELASGIERGDWPNIEQVQSVDLPRRFSYVLSPERTEFLK